MPIFTRFRLLLIPLLSLALSKAEIPADENFKVEALSKGLHDPMELAVADSGHVFIAERKGAVKLFDPETSKTKTIHNLAVSIRKGNDAPENRESGLLGITLDPEFESNGGLYLYYSPKGKDYHQLSRFTFKRNALSNEKLILKVPRDIGHNICHEGGSLAFGNNGLLYLSTGDNTNPFENNGYTPIDERKGNEWGDAQRSAGNTNDLRGKILRIKPKLNGGYEIPEGNLFPKGTAKTKPEIYIMGCRNPYRITVDPKTDYLYWGKVGPDGSKKSARGPSGYDEINQAKEAGNYGWPYFSGENEPYADYDFESEEIGDFFDPKKPINKSPNNTGLEILPPAQPAFATLRRSCYAAGAVYYSDLYPESTAKFPSSLDSSLFTFDWNKGKFIIYKLGKDGKKGKEHKIFQKHRFLHTTDVQFGADGTLYVLEYGSKWYNGTNGKLTRITYSEDKIEIAEEKEDPRLEGMPADHPGTKILSSSTCLACHLSNQTSIGPQYSAVAKKYASQKDAAEYLAKKILEGSVGVWGQQPMPPHPQHKIEEALQMADAILQTQPTAHE